MDFHFASAWEVVSDTYPNRTATIADGRALAWRDFERRASSVAGLLDAYGIKAGSKVGLYLHNSSEYQEAQFGVFKVDACPINVNYRYKADELVYLLNNSDAEALVFQSCYAMRIWEIKDRLPNVKLLVQVDDGTETLLKGAVDYERGIRDNAPLARQQRDPNSIYMLYTGGTTGMPKGVMYPQGGFAQLLIGMGAAGRELLPPENLADYQRFLEQIEAPPVSLPACPLMHGTGVWLGSFLPMSLGGTVVTTSKLGLNPDLLLGLVEDHRVSDIVIVGDAFARPILDALDFVERRGTPYNLDSLRQITSGGVMWSQEVKQGLLRHQDLILADLMGSTEGSMGSSVTTRDDVRGTAKFDMAEGVKVVTDDGRFVTPGSGEMGKIATSGFVPLGYYKDPEKSAETFQEIDGVRYSLPGDYATIEADGTITLLGRGSVCINTGGEKVFPEEVEEAVKRHVDVEDCLVVGVPDERFGERIVAVTSARDELSLNNDDLMAFTADHLAGYKQPRQIVQVETVRRAPNGKADYKWAKACALKAVAAGTS